ncbi:MAG: DUF2288 domain-containing protein [Gammaproteobacteria bacterium]|jgi:hypothetical protein|nr:DUF2288 domain-containing protein [Gammaproteobacteria bacterium]MBU1482480.1 DUF2288 domain-containing protein [Gammaproteobacteria bacterium]
MTTLSQQEIDRINLNLETSKIAWEELQRFFASGKAIFVSDTLDLIDVAIQISRDNKDQTVKWMEAGLVTPVTDAQALAWHEADAQVWAVVVRPYVLVQSVK